VNRDLLKLFPLSRNQFHRSWWQRCLRNRACDGSCQRLPGSAPLAARRGWRRALLRGTVCGPGR